MTRVLITAAVSLVLCVGIGYLLLPVLRALKAGQSIREVGPTWHNNKAGTPMMGGLMFIFSAIICILGNLFVGKIDDFTVLYVLGLSLCFGLVGFLDDFFKIKHKQNLGLTSMQKFLLQLAVCALYLYLMWKFEGMSTDLYIPFVDKSIYGIPTLLYIAFAMFVMVGCVNAVNLTDGVDGLCGTVTIPVMIFFAAVAVMKGKYDLALLPAALAGALVSYLVYNWHPAKVFMGDTGSLFLGGVVCALAFALDMPLILLPVGIVYMLETLSVLLQVGYFKLTHGKRIFKMAPIHHHFEMCGWKEVTVVLVFTAVSILGCVAGWFGIRVLF